MDTLETLVAAPKRLRYARNWTQGVSARDKCNASVPAWSKSAVCWCSQGAIIASTPAEEDWLPAHRALSAVLDVIDDNPVVKFNDAPERTHDQVLAAFDAAIAKLEAQS